MGSNPVGGSDLFFASCTLVYSPSCKFTIFHLSVTLICFKICVYVFLHFIDFNGNYAFLILFIVICFVSYLCCDWTCKVAFYVAKSQSL